MIAFGFTILALLFYVDCCLFACYTKKTGRRVKLWRLKDEKIRKIARQPLESNYNCLWKVKRWTNKKSNLVVSKTNSFFIRNGKRKEM